jgi:hypothetical protein
MGLLKLLDDSGPTAKVVKSNWETVKTISDGLGRCVSLHLYGLTSESYGAFNALMEEARPWVNMSLPPKNVSLSELL